MCRFRNPLFFLLFLHTLSLFHNTIKILSILLLVASNIMRLTRLKIKMFESIRKKWVDYLKRFIRRSGAQVFSILISPTGKLDCFVSPNTTDKEMCHEYLMAKGIDLSELDSHYQKMQEDLEKLRERNDMLRREIGQRKGRDLQDLSFDQLRELEGTMMSSLDAVHQQKLLRMEGKTHMLKRKVTLIRFQMMRENMLQ